MKKKKIFWWWRDAKHWWVISMIDARRCLLNILKEAVGDILTKKQAKIF